MVPGWEGQENTNRMAKAERKRRQEAGRLGEPKRENLGGKTWRLLTPPAQIQGVVEISACILP